VLKHHKLVLPNGVRFISVPMAGATSCAMRVAVACGSMDENPGNNGLSHFLEHVSFKGTPDYATAMARSLALESLGAEENAVTSEYHTTHYLSVVPEHARRAASILLDTCFKPRFGTAEVDLERDVIIQEILGGKDEPGDYMWDELKRLAYDGTSLALPVCGTADSVKLIHEEDLLAYQARHYVGRRVVVVLVGALDQTGNWGAELGRLGSLPKGDCARQSIVLEPQTGPRFAFISKDREQASLILAFRMPPGLNEEERVTVRVIESILSDGMGCRFFQKLREERGLVYHVGASIARFPGHSLFKIEAEMESGNVLEAVKAILEELRCLSSEAANDQELHRAKEYYWGLASRSLVDPDAVAAHFATMAMLDLPLKDPYGVRGLQLAVTPRQIMALADWIFRSENVNLVLSSRETSEQFVSQLKSLF
jgi:predicted Zn-dependent peptidase